MHPVRTAALLIVALVATAGAIAVAQPGGDRIRNRAAIASLEDGSGNSIGRVTFRQLRTGGTVTVSARVRGLPAGFHGFHVHEAGKCEGPAFTTALGHLRREGQTHSNHLGDLPTLLVNEDGRGKLSASTDRFKLSDLRDGDGSAVIVHANPDNYANIPTDRYTPAPDQMTLDTGDAGPRRACGRVR